MKRHRLIKVFSSRPAITAGWTVLVGLALLTMPAFDAWIRASYDCLYRFAARPPAAPEPLVVIRMDNSSYHQEGLTRPNWSRILHARLARKLADDGARLVVFDVHFEQLGQADEDAALADALRRCPRVALMADLVESTRPDASSPGHEATVPVPPAELFSVAAGSHWGIGAVTRDEADLVVRRHWPFPAPSSDRLDSLAWVAARLAEARLPEQPCYQWLRYYGRDGAWNALSFHSALEQESNYFAGKVVFIGNEPETPEVGDEQRDEFRTPYTAWNEGRGVGGVEILATTYLNLVNHDWLERFPAWIEAILLVTAGMLLGGGFGVLRLCWAVPIAGLAAASAGLAAVGLTYWTNFWFPWLIVAGGQIPSALILSGVMRRSRVPAASAHTPTVVIRPVSDLPLGAWPGQQIPETPGYELVLPAFGSGGYGKVWLARNVAGQWQALKAVYLAKFENNPEPYDREFRGITRFKLISKRHLGLLEVDYISLRHAAGYFYYVMELGDGAVPGWEANPAAYRPNDLAGLCSRAPLGRLPVRDCVRIGIPLAGTLAFLHDQGLTHRDIKPSNIIFVNHQPKFADVGLVADANPNQPHSIVGTVGYMPVHPEPPGTPAADIRALGMVLYVISTGQPPHLFPSLSTSLVAEPDNVDYMQLNRIILKACHPHLAERYASATDLKSALEELARVLNPSGAA